MSDATADIESAPFKFVQTTGGDGTRNFRIDDGRSKAGNGDLPSVGVTADQEVDAGLRPHQLNCAGAVSDEKTKVVLSRGLLKGSDGRRRRGLEALVGNTEDFDVAISQVQVEFFVD